MTENETPPSLSQRLMRRAPIVVILALGLIALVLFRDWLSFDRLAENRSALLALRDQHYLLASVLFLVTYTLVVVLSIPGAIVLSLTGGFLFGLFPGLLYNAAAATTGATAVFIAARAGFGRDVAQGIDKRGGALARLAQSLRENEVSVLLTMRLIPFVPFFLANLAASTVGVRLRTFALTTFVGILPAGYIYTQLGAGLGEVFARGERPNLSILAQPAFLWPLLALAFLSLLPLLLKLRK